MKKTNEERNLLSKLAGGKLDGQVGDDLITSGGSTVWKAIIDGIPGHYKQGPGGKSFNGKENIRYSGKNHILQLWKTDNEKLDFLQRFGWLIDDADAKAYSAKFKPKK